MRRLLPAGAAEATTVHGVVHSAAPVFSALAGIAAYVLFARWFAGRGRRAWMWYCVLMIPAMVVLDAAAAALADFRGHAGGDGAGLGVDHAARPAPAAL